MSSVTDIPTIPGEIFAKFQTSFYSEPFDAVFKALGVIERQIPAGRAEASICL